MSSELNKKLDKVLETVAVNGAISGYQLKNMLGVPLSTAQRWLLILKRSGHVTLYETKTRPIKRKLYGLTFLGLLDSLSQPRVEKNFSKVLEAFISSLPTEKGIENRLKTDLLEAVKDETVLNGLKEYYLAIADALVDLENPQSLPFETLTMLASYLASIREPDRMMSILKDLYPKVLFIRLVVDAYRKYASDLDKIVKGEI